MLLIVQADDNVNKGKLRVAVEDYKAALALDPNHLAHNVHLHLGLCKLLVKLGRGKDALTSCDEALSIDGELLDALVQASCLCFQLSLANQMPCISSIKTISKSNFSPIWHSRFSF